MRRHQLPFQLMTAISLWFAVAASCNTAENILTNQPISIAVVGIHNATRDPSLEFWREGLWWLLEEGIQQARTLRLVTAYLDPSEINAQQAGNFGVGLEARRVLWGSYSRQNGEWAVRFYVENVATGQVSTNISIASGDWFDIRDGLMEAILRELHLSPSQPEKREILRRFTPSAMALEWFRACFKNADFPL